MYNVPLLHATGYMVSHNKGDNSWNPKDVIRKKNKISDWSAKNRSDQHIIILASAYGLPWFGHSSIYVSKILTPSDTLIIS